LRTARERYEGGAAPTETLVLPFEERQRSRLKVRLASEGEILLLMPRGTVLRHGDLVRADDGAIVRIEAAEEELSVVEAADPWMLARAAYHLGNRHIALQIDPQRLAYLHDHVLDHMVQELGLGVEVKRGRFEPEAGAYGGHRGETHGHGHAHSHGD
jgi:urease accessory protein